MPLARANPGKTGFVAIDDGRLAFETRLHLARSAERSIDVQTYICHGDDTGTLMFEGLRGRPTGACACGCCSTTPTSSASIRPRAPDAPPTSRCGSSIRSRAGLRGLGAT